MRRNSFVIAVSTALMMVWSSAEAQPIYGGGDGSSMAKAIVINADHEPRGVAAEREWIQSHLPGWTVKRQALVGKSGRRYDRITVVSPNGEQKDVYFDVTGFFGKP